MSDGTKVPIAVESGAMWKSTAQCVRNRDKTKNMPTGAKPETEAKRGPVTLLYRAHDTEHNGARVLCEYLADRGKRRAPRAVAKRRPPPRRR